MSTTRMKEREKARRTMVAKGQVERAALRAIIKDPKVDYEEKMTAVIKLNKRPRDEDAARLRNRCNLCGRSRGVYRRFGLCRCCLRKVFMFGLIPGVRKASW